VRTIMTAAAGCRRRPAYVLSPMQEYPNRPIQGLASDATRSRKDQRSLAPVLQYF